MAKICNCHKKREAAMAGGMDFATAQAKYGKPGYHEHRCECPCGCKSDTLGTKYCPYCHFEHASKRGEEIGLLGIPFPKDE
jgi:hypothetical protein